MNQLYLPRSLCTWITEASFCPRKVVLQCPDDLCVAHLSGK